MAKVLKDVTQIRQYSHARTHAGARTHTQIPAPGYVMYPKELPGENVPVCICLPVCQRLPLNRRIN